jgi:hypothetical protein
MRTQVALISLAALGIGVLIGGHMQPRAAAGPTVVLARDQRPEVLTANPDGTSLLLWTMDEYGVRSVTVNSLSFAGERPVLRKQLVLPEAGTAPKNEGGGK